MQIYIYSEKVITASTGVIGLPMPIDIVTRGIKNTYHCLNNDRQASVSIEIEGKIVKIGGMAKG